MADTNAIDFVITWVDGHDPAWQAKKAQYTGAESTEGNTDVRYRDWDTLKYWFRGVEMFAPWVRYIYFVTDGQKPDWLNIQHPKLRWVKHTDFIPKEYLPTFNTNAIEFNLYKCPNLAEQFVYFNDDVFLISKTKPQDFFVNGLPCDRPGVGCCMPTDFFSYLPFNNTYLLNRHFSLKKAIRKDWKKWFCYQPVKELLKLLWYGRHDAIPGTNDQHIHISFRKETFQQVWEKEYALLHETCTHKLRTREDVTDWCVRNWQLLTGNFHPARPIGKAFSTSELDRNSDALMYMRCQKGKVICLNDNENEKNYEEHKKMVIEEFERLLPHKSAFEY